MNNRDLVSVIIPTYNRADKISDAVESAINQSYPNKEIIVVDDGSTDDTALMMRKFPQVIYMHQAHKGQSAARNRGLQKAKGTFITSLDSDDIWEPEFLEICMHKLEEEHLDFVFTNWYQDNGENGWRDFILPNPFMQPFLHRAVNHWISLDGEELRQLYLTICPSPSSSALIRRTSIQSKWNEDICIGDDWCMYLDMILHKECHIAFTTEKLWKKRIDKINIYEGRPRKKVLQSLYIHDYELFIKRYQPLLNEDELALLKIKYMKSLVELTKHYLIHEFNLPKAYHLLKRSLNTDSKFTLKIIPHIFAAGVMNRLNNLL